MKPRSLLHGLPVFIISLLLVFITSSQAAFSAPDLLLQQRSATYQQVEQLNERNQQLLQEMLTLEARRQLLAHQLAQASQAENSARQAAHSAYQEYRQAEQNKKQSQQQLAYWLNWYYRHSWLELLTFLLESKNAADFAQRTYYVYMLAKKFGLDWTRTSNSCLALAKAQNNWKQQIEYWQKTQALLVQKKLLLNQAIAQKKSYLDNLKRQSLQLAAYLTELETYCLNGIGILPRLTETIANLPWQKIDNYQVSWQKGQAVVKVDEKEITRLLADSSELPPGSNISFSPNRWRIEIPSGENWPALCLEGKTENTAAGPALWPLRLTLDGWPVQQQLLEQLLPPSSPDWQFAYGKWQFKVTGLQIIQGAILIAMELNQR
ncbi:MAG: hypothetical protein ACOY81_00435 [Bacillota bacterium]